MFRENVWTIVIAALAMFIAWGFFYLLKLFVTI